MASRLDRFFIDGQWIEAKGDTHLDVIDPTTEQPIGSVAMATRAEVDAAVLASRKAFPSYAATSRAERLQLLQAIIEIYRRRAEDLADALASELGAPLTLGRCAQVPAGLAHLVEAASILKTYEFDQVVNNTTITREPIGVCAFITPWNWPLNQIACKVAPALAAGCTMILKPSELAPLSATIFAEILQEAQVPAGVFNLMHGGPKVGQLLSSHPAVDMISFTGSTRAGVAVAKNAADTVKRVQQELGGKSANIILDDADLEAAVRQGIQMCFRNSGQSCNAPTRMLVSRQQYAQAVEIAAQAAEQTVCGDPRSADTVMGPVVSKAQFDKIQDLIAKGLQEGAKLVAGGLQRPAGIDLGYFVRPTVLADVDNSMTVAREEIFGPVLSIIPYDSEEAAIDIANDTVYGLSAYVSSTDIERARRVARQLRAGMVHINGAPTDPAAAFGGYKQSGNGREWGRHGFEEFLEVKSMFGYAANAQ